MVEDYQLSQLANVLGVAIFGLVVMVRGAAARVWVTCEQYHFVAPDRRD